MGVIVNKGVNMNVSFNLTKSSFKDFSKIDPDEW